MAYAQVHTAAFRHPKVVSLSDAAFRLWVAGLAYCQEHLTDGVILECVLPAIGVKTGKRIICELETSRLWERRPGAGWFVHDYLDWNASREAVTERRERARRRMEAARSRARSREQGEEHTSHVREPIRNDTQRNDTQESTNHSPPDPLAERFARFWAAYPRKVGKGAAERVWKRLKPSDAMADLMLQAVERQRMQPQWTRDNGQFVPHPATWLSQGRWDDEVEPVRDRSGLAVVREEWTCPHEPHCGSKWRCQQLQDMAAEAKASA